MSHYTYAWLLLAGCLANPAIAQPAASLCGIDAANVAAMQAKVAADARFKRDGGDAEHETWSAESIQAILTFTTAKMAAYPAAICQQVVTKGATTQIESKVRCEAGAEPCADLEAEVAKADDSSGDGP